jgi:uncharacterized protein YxjI
MFRHRREGPGPRRFRMREQLLAIGDDYWIEDDTGERVYRVNGKVARVRDTWKLEDRAGADLARIHEHVFSIRDAMTIEFASGGSARVKKALVGVRARFRIEIDDGDELKAHGNIVDHEYEIERRGDTVARVSKKWFRLRETYGVDVYPREDPVLVLAVTVAIDGLSNDR